MEGGGSAWARIQAPPSPPPPSPPLTSSLASNEPADLSALTMQRVSTLASSIQQRKKMTSPIQEEIPLTSSSLLMNAAKLKAQQAISIPPPDLSARSASSLSNRPRLYSDASKLSFDEDVQSSDYEIVSSNSTISENVDEMSNYSSEHPSFRRLPDRDVGVGQKRMLGRRRLSYHASPQDDTTRSESTDGTVRMNICPAEELQV